jgi:hypothetical protein
LPGSKVRPGSETTGVEARVVDSSSRGVLVELKWRERGIETDRQRYQALRVRDGVIVDMQDYLHERDARRALRLS